MFVDVPGYGYANTSRTQLVKFGEMMEDYFGERSQKKGLVLIVDSRHKPSEDDITMMEYARYFDISVIVIATKIDKLNRSQREKHIKIIKDELEMDDTDVLISFSSETREGVEAAWQAIESLY